MGIIKLKKCGLYPLSTLGIAIDKEAPGYELPHAKQVQEDKMESSHCRDKDLKRKEMSLPGTMLSQRETMWAVLHQKGIPLSLGTSGANQVFPLLSLKERRGCLSF